MPDAKYAWLQSALIPDAVVITASRRLARHLRIACADVQLSAGRKAWPTPQVHAFEDWCRARYDERDDGRGAPMIIEVNTQALATG